MNSNVNIPPFHVFTPPPPTATPVYSDKLNVSNIAQFDGNESILSESLLNTNQCPVQNNGKKQDKISAALSLPTVATYNLRSFFPKAGNLTTDMLERSIDLGFLVEIWENSTKAVHRLEIERMLEMSGLEYISTARPPNAKGVSYGGAAIVVNVEKFSIEKLDVHIPKNLEAQYQQTFLLKSIISLFTPVNVNTPITLNLRPVLS